MNSHEINVVIGGVGGGDATADHVHREVETVSGSGVYPPRSALLRVIQGPAVSGAALSRMDDLMRTLE